MLSEDKIEGVLDCVKFISKKIKEQKIQVEKAEKDYGYMGGFEDCGESYMIWFYEEKASLNTMINLKISLEKYSKKLKHELKGE